MAEPVSLAASARPSHASVMNETGCRSRQPGGILYRSLRRRERDPPGQRGRSGRGCMSCGCFTRCDRLCPTVVTNWSVRLYGERPVKAHHPRRGDGCFRTWPCAAAVGGTAAVPLGGFGAARYFSHTATLPKNRGFARHGPAEKRGSQQKKLRSPSQMTPQLDRADEWAGQAFHLIGDDVAARPQTRG